MTIVATAERMRLRVMEPADVAPLLELNADPDVVRWTGDGAFQSEAEVLTVIENQQAREARDGYSRWIIERLEDDALLGWSGLKLMDDGLIDLGYRLHQRYWGVGYATEAARATIARAFSALDLESLLGRAAFDNKASIRVLEKVGFQFDRRGDCEGFDAVYYTLRNE